jgi:ArsR family transcriptional regulator, virulence genes transcriptional regulator
MNVKDMAHGSAAAARFLKAVGNEKRLQILCQLLGRERSVGELQAALGLRQSALSQHLARLRRDRLVATRREAQTIYYALAEPAVSDVIGLLYRRFCAPAQASPALPS